MRPVRGTFKINVLSMRQQVIREQEGNNNNVNFPQQTYLLFKMASSTSKLFAPSTFKPDRIV